MCKFYLILTALLLTINNHILSQSLTIGTYNIRFDNSADAGNLWKDRAPVVVSLIRFHDFDILGTQEGYENQLAYISDSLPEYNRYGVGRDDGKDAGEHSAIFYKKERFALLDKGDFWLSETPEKPSKGWDATCCMRLCSWVKLKDKETGKKFWFFNAHYDHEGKTAREESSELILKKIKEIAGDGLVILTGDLNGGHSSGWYQRIVSSGVLKDTYGQVTHPYTNNPTFNGFGKRLPGNEIIDHIFTSGGFKTTRCGILSDSYNGKYPSDHFPVLAEMEYGDK